MRAERRRLWVKQATNQTELFSYLGELIQAARQQGSRLGYFPASYRYVATTLLARNTQGVFQHPEMIEAMALGLFNRYFAALQQYQAGELPARGWLLAFEAAQNSCPTVAQQIMLSINPHINFDLAIVVARACQPHELPAIHGDFLKMIGILAPLVDTIVASLGKLSPLFAAVYRPVENIPINVSVSVMSRNAWNVARKLSAQSVPDQVRTIARVDAQVQLLGRALLGLSPVLAPFRLSERGTVGDVLDLLTQLVQHDT
jgi:hypothetical protein